jgi:hypothetical protein
VRNSVRAAISSASHGASAHVPMTAIAGAIEEHGLRVCIRDTRNRSMARETFTDPVA